MTFFRLISLAMSFLAGCLLLSARELPGDREATLSIYRPTDAVLDEKDNIWHGLSNPTSLDLFPEAGNGTTQLGGLWEGGDFHRAKDPEEKYALNFHSDSHRRFKALDLYGSFDFNQTWYGNRAWSDLSDPYDNNPYQAGSGIPAELGGNIPTSGYYDKLYGKGRWRFQTIVSLSIGQGEIGATPLQIANLAAIMANRGYWYIPHLVKDSENVEIDPKYKERHYTLVDTAHFATAVEGMYKAVNGGGSAGGTAFAAAVPGLDVCGKTGTAQNPHGEDNSVFICFAPKDDPKIAVAAYVENAGVGATWALPVASLMLEKYLTGEICPQRQYLEKRMLETKFF